jgi:predicted permease
MRFAFRSLRRKPVFTVAAVLTIALAIGANTALFGVIYAVLLQPLPFRDPSRLVQIWQTHPSVPQLQLTVPDFRVIAAQSKSFEQVAAHTLSAMNNGVLLGQGDPAVVHATMATSNLAATMGVQSLMGRFISEEEDRAKQRVAVLSETLWRRQFGADRMILGKQIRIDTESFTVVGVIPQRQAFPEWAEVWIPMALIEQGLSDRRKFHPLEIISRLKPGVTAEQADLEIQGIALQLRQSYPDTNGMIGAYVIPLSREMTRNVRPSLLLAWSAGGLVLLIACANLAHLFMARMLERREELRIREALGAGARRLIAQVLTESLVVAGAGAAVGIALSFWARQLLHQLAPAQIPRLDEATPAAPAWLFAAGLALICGLLFGLPACWQVMRSSDNLAARGRSVVAGRSRLRALLMAGEVAMALLVLTGAALLTRSFAALLSENPGFKADGVLMIPNVPLRRDFNSAPAFLSKQLMPMVRRIPGVEDVAAVNSAPMSLGSTEHSRYATRFGLEGRKFDPGSYPVAQTRFITPEYFGVLGVPLKSGRWLTDSDLGQPRILINQTLARRFFSGQDPVGKRLVLGVMDPQQSLNEIVGVVGDVRDFGLDQEAEPTFYGVGPGPVTTLLIKSGADHRVSWSVIAGAVHQADPDIPVTRIQPLQQNVSDSLARRRFALFVLGLFGGIAAFLTAAGIYGLLAYSVNARVRELGVRAAVGATSQRLVVMILREAAVLTFPGLITGAALSVGFATLMKSLVSPLSPMDPISLGAGATMLVILTLAAAWLPARRAASTDPAIALRAE